MDDEQIGPEGDAIEPGGEPTADVGGAEADDPAAVTEPRTDPRPDSGSDAGQTALPVAPEPTGLSTVDAALERLGDLEHTPLDEHVEIFDNAQRQLHDALVELDDEQ